MVFMAVHQQMKHKPRREAVSQLPTGAVEVTVGRWIARRRSEERRNVGSRIWWRQTLA
jgi:hypothetical protein